MASTNTPSGGAQSTSNAPRFKVQNQYHNQDLSEYGWEGVIISDYVPNSADMVNNFVKAQKGDKIHITKDQMKSPTGRVYYEVCFVGDGRKGNIWSNNIGKLHLPALGDPLTVIMNYRSQNTNTDFIRLFKDDKGYVTGPGNTSNTYRVKIVGRNKAEGLAHTDCFRVHTGRLGQSTTIEGFTCTFSYDWTPSQDEASHNVIPVKAGDVGVVISSARTGANQNYYKVQLSARNAQGFVPFHSCNLLWTSPVNAWQWACIVTQDYNPNQDMLNKGAVVVAAGTQAFIGFPFLAEDHYKITFLSQGKPASGFVHKTCLRISTPNTRQATTPVVHSEYGWPCTVKKDWQLRPRTANSNILDLKRGQEGVIVSERLLGSGGKGIWYKIRLVRTGEEGYAPNGELDVHRSRRYGSLKIMHDMPKVDYAALDLQTLDWTVSDKTDEVFLALLQGLRTNIERLPFIRPGVRNILMNDNRRKTSARNILRGFEQPYRNVLNNDRSTLRDLEDTCYSVPKDNSDMRIGGYARVTKKFRDQNRLPEFYTGQTVNSFSARFQGHRNPPPKGSRHASTASNSVVDSSEIAMYILFILTQGDVDEALLGELLCMLMNGSFHPGVLSIVKATIQANASSDEALRESIFEATLNDENIATAQTAEVIGSIAQDVWTKTNFTPLALRKGFGIGTGLNKSIPIQEDTHYEKTMYVRVSQPEVKESYYRSGVRLKAGQSTNGALHLINFWRKRDSTSSSFYVGLGKDDPGPQVGAMIYPVFEIMLSGPHPTPWARLHEVGMPKDWHLANRLGVRLDWKSNDSWKSIYVQAGQVMSFEPTNDRGAMSTYNKALAVIRFLTQRDVRDAAGWYLIAGIARVSALEYHHAHQVISIRPLPPGRELRRAGNRTDQEIAQLLRATGVINVAGTWRTFGWPSGHQPANTKGWGARRKACDACYIHAYFDGLSRRADLGWSIDCNQRTDPQTGKLTDICETCWHRGLVCSWTWTTDEQDFPIAYLRAVSFQAAKPIVVKNITPRMLFEDAAN